MSSLFPCSIQCPYCWETIEILVDTSVPQQDYTEDCQVCCRPIEVSVLIDADGEPLVEVSSEDES